MLDYHVHVANCYHHFECLYILGWSVMGTWVIHSNLSGHANAFSGVFRTFPLFDLTLHRSFRNSFKQLTNSGWGVLTGWEWSSGKPKQTSSVLRLGLFWCKPDTLIFVRCLKSINSGWSHKIWPQHVDGMSIKVWPRHRTWAHCCTCVVQQKACLSIACPVFKLLLMQSSQQ